MSDIPDFNFKMFEILVRFPITTPVLETPTRESFADDIFTQVLYEGVEGIEHHIEEIVYIDDAPPEMVEQLVAPVDFYQQRIQMAQAMLEAYNQLIYRDQSDIKVPLENEVSSLITDILLWCSEYGMDPYATLGQGIHIWMIWIKNRPKTES